MTTRSLGQAVTFTGVPPGGWFGEGTLLKRESYRYNIQALRRSVVAGLPIDSFHELLDNSLAFNRFMLNQLNERLGQFIAAREIDCSTDPDLRVARNLAALFHPQLYPGVGSLLRITQQELGYLVGLSRQRVNEALKHLAAQHLISIEYGGLRVLDLQGLRCFEQATPDLKNLQARLTLYPDRPKPGSRSPRAKACFGGPTIRVQLLLAQNMSGTIHVDEIASAVAD